MNNKNFLMVIIAFCCFLTFSQSAGAKYYVDIESLVEIFDYKSDVFESDAPKVMFYASFDKRRDILVLKEFINNCSKYNNIKCICVDKSNYYIDQTKHTAKKFKNSCYVYAETNTNRYLKPYLVFLKKDNSLFKKIDYASDFVPMLNAYLGYLNKDYGKEKLTEQLASVDRAEEIERIVPKLNFILMLAKKGERAKAVKKLDEFDISMKTNKSEVELISRIYLKLKAPEKALQVLSYCDTNGCKFYEAVSLYKLGKVEKSEKIFKFLEEKRFKFDSVNNYLDKINESQKGPADEN